MRYRSPTWTLDIPTWSIYIWDDVASPTWTLDIPTCGVSCDVEVLRGLPSYILSEFETKHNIHNAPFHMLAILHVL